MRTDRLLIQDMLDSIAEVMETTPASQSEFDANKLVRSHVLRHVQIIGEAAWRLTDALKEQYPQLPWKKMAGMRHVLVHDYFDVNWNRVYATARDQVPPLKEHLQAILASIGFEDTPS